MLRTPAGYRIRRKDVVLDSIPSAPFEGVDFIADRQKIWA
jgi:hypothetical protein